MNESDALSERVDGRTHLHRAIRDENLAIILADHAAKDVHQGAFSRAAGAHDCDVFIVVDGETDAIEGADVFDTNAVVLGDVFETDDHGAAEVPGHRR